MRWTDGHCHLPEDASALAEVLGEARAAGVVRMVDVGCDLASSRAAMARAAAHDGVWATVGVHPHDARTLFRADGTWDDEAVGELERLAAADGVVAVGEAGLDYHYDHSPRHQQREAFARQVALARRLGRALVIHTREAWDDTFAVLAAEGVPEHTVLHCFTGGPAEATQCLDLGVHLSFSGVVSFRGAPEVREAAARCPLDRMLVETDSPYLAPVPHRGRRNRPAWVADVGVALAAATGRPVEEVAAATWSTAERVYGLPAGDDGEADPSPAPGGSVDRGSRAPGSA